MPKLRVSVATDAIPSQGDRPRSGHRSDLLARLLLWHVGDYQIVKQGLVLAVEGPSDRELLPNLPADLGVAIVIVNHLRTVATRLHEILPRFTAMPVELITEKLLIQPNHVFIIPAQRDLHVLNGEFRLKPISKPRGWPDVITVFLRSLTKHWDGKLVAVIVSGYDGDGAAALCGIKEVGGITIAQKLDTAGQPDMPESAIASGCVDFVLSPEDIHVHLLAR